MKGSLTIGHVRGIPIRAHFSLLFILPYLAFLMATRFADVAEQAGVAGEAVALPPVAWGLILAVLLFACVFLHELGHSLLALRYGGAVSSITLMLLGGVSELHGLPKTARAEGMVAVVGPIVSAVLGGIGLALHAVIPGPADLRFGLYYLGEINLALAVFNILPAFPMDGGRVLRAILSLRWSRETATKIAAATGVAFATLFFVGGFLTANFILMLIGFFVWSGAQAETRMVMTEKELRGLTVRDVMSPTRVTVDAHESVANVAAMMAQSHATALPVLEGTKLAGVVASHHVELTRPEEREQTPVAAITERNVPRLHAEEPLSSALERMAEQRSSEAPVLEHGELVGVLEVSDLNRALRLRKLAPRPDRRRAPLAPPIFDDQPDAVERVGQE